MNTRDPRRDGWHPVASSTDLVRRHIFHGRLWGQELAIWRADDGNVNVWENRCLHRGVRLTIGVNLGHELMCQYHGWRYANRSAGCTYIPAHPADAPARTVCNRTFAAIECHGLVWACLDSGSEAASLPEVPEGSSLLRAVSIDAPAGDVADALRERGARQEDTFRLWDEECKVRFILQPADAGVTIVRGILAPDAAAGLDDLRALDHRLCLLRDTVEAGVRKPVVAIEPEFSRVPAELATMPERAPRSAVHRMLVERKWPVAGDVMAFRLSPLDGMLPSFQPGAHIDVHLPNGLIRQYSLTNGPDDTTAFVIGVKREPDGKGGSAALHDHVREGDVLAVGEPRNNFPLRRDQLHTRLIAGGIGVTPLLAMARTLDLSGVSFRMHVLARTKGALPFAGELERFGDRVQFHLGLDPEQSSAAFRAILAGQGEKEAVYVCGPPAMLDAVRRIAAESGWDDDQVHFEYFANEHDLDKSSGFAVDLARSALTLDVPPGRSIVEVLRDNGIDLPTSCEKGACGTCRVEVIEGEIDHQDVYLTEAEKADGRCMMACVSRARGDRLVLDL
ncbi:MAG: 2Fe-2S iron-sulfur cluster binding domain-containing protein [Geminicoccaceae bacterium]|nr:2Fe-2S iron-sulfur cluster binding domain-containing protein [Geminicoccaceae bacterium]